MVPPGAETRSDGGMTRPSGTARTIVAVDALARLRRDLRQPDRPVGRQELLFLAGTAIVVVIVAQVTDPGTQRDVGLLAAAAAMMAAGPLLAKVPVEIYVAAVVVPVVVALEHQGRLEVGLFLVVITTLYVAWYLGSTTRVVLVAIGCCAAFVVLSALQPENLSLPAWLGAELFTLALGRTLFRQRRLIDELESARRVLAERAVAEERRRIARELHDLAGHTLAAMLLHVTGARHVLRRDVDEADRALVEAEAVGRASLDQIRATVAALRTTERGTDPALPNGGIVDGPVADYRRAGLLIEARVGPGVEALTGPVAVALHRISREALANVARHAPSNRVVLVAQLDRHLDEVHLAVSDHGRAPSPGPGQAGGFGLVGMSERARSLGGALVAEPTKDGWQVEVTLPATIPAAGGPVTM